MSTFEGAFVDSFSATLTPIAAMSVDVEGTVRVSFDADGNGLDLDLGREQRLFTARQRTALTARDGGCRFLGCDRPPEWCEAHHIDHWQRDGGRTDLDRGIPLCRHHHMLTHNNGWASSTMTPGTG